MGMWLTQIIYSIVKNFHERFKFLNLKIRGVMRIKILNSCLYRTITFKQLDVFKNILFYMRFREDTTFILSLQFFLIEFDILMLTTHILNWHCRWPCLSICFFHNPSKCFEIFFMYGLLSIFCWCFETFKPQAAVVTTAFSMGGAYQDKRKQLSYI